MDKRVQRSVKIALALVLALVVCTGCAPTGGEGVTPELTATLTTIVETTAPVKLTPTATVVSGGGGGEATQEPTLAPLCPNLELEIVFQQLQSMQVGEMPLENAITASGLVPLSVDVDVSPPKVSGEGKLPVSGGGHIGECAFQNSGSVAYRFEGEIVPGPNGRLELHLGGQRSMNVVASELCGGSGTTPFEDMGEQVLMYEDGHTLEWSWQVSAAGVEGSSEWTLHILCEE